jgi:anti-sigma28 factor (negative regulator of flagellin synthesis)
MVYALLRCQVGSYSSVTRVDSEVAVKFAGKNVKFLALEQLLIPTLQTRKHRITQLRRAVESGCYRVSSEQIAEKMLQEARLDRLL